MIVFGSEVRLASTPRDLLDFTLPELTTGGLSSLGLALNFLLRCVDDDRRRGDHWKPVAFLFTDGCATDEWEQAADEVRAAGDRLTTVVLLCGAHGDLVAAGRITDHVIAMHDINPARIERYVRLDSLPATAAFEVPPDEPPPIVAFS